VDTNGNIRPPNIGLVKVVGLKPEEIKKHIQTVLFERGYGLKRPIPEVPAPEVDVEILANAPAATSTAPATAPAKP